MSESFLGSKAASGAYQAIIANMPAHDFYIETHLGSGAIMKRKQPAAVNYGVEIDPDTLKKTKANLQELISKNDSSKFLFRNQDCVKFLKEFERYRAKPGVHVGNVFIYADPPYLWSTRTSRHKYRFEYDEADHIQLLETLKDSAMDFVKIMISGYPNSLYDQMLAGWHSLEFRVMTRGGPRTEKIWMNYDPTKIQPHYFDYAGSNYTDRQRIKRKAERWKANYEVLPPQEKAAIMAAMLQVSAVENDFPKNAGANVSHDVID